MSSSLENLRKSIDHLDAALMLLVTERSNIIVSVGVLKKQHKLPLNYSPEREQDLQKTQNIAQERGLNEHFIKNLFQIIYEDAITQMETTQPRTDQSHQQKKELTSYRESIYNLDIAICHILAERFHVVSEIGKTKRHLGKQPLDTGRWEQLLQNKLDTAEKLGINTKFIRSIFNLIHEYSLSLQI